MALEKHYEIGECRQSIRSDRFIIGAKIRYSFFHLRQSVETVEWFHVTGCRDRFPCVIESRATMNPFSDSKQHPSIRSIALSGVGLALAIALQALQIPTPLNGVLVNALFVVLSRLTGLGPVMAVGFLTPIGALLTGHLPPLLFPLVPFIAVGNAIYIFSYIRLAMAGSLWRWAAGPVFKSAIIAGGGFALIQTLEITPALRAGLLAIVGIQLATAVGGIVLGEILLGRLSGFIRIFPFPATMAAGEKHGDR